VRPKLLGLAALALASGAAALVVETTWLRWFRLLLGATAPAASATLVAFFAGHALGAVGGARWARRARRPLAAYAGLELCAAAAALLTVPLLAAGEAGLAGGYDALRQTPGLLLALRFAVALLVSLPASACYGATLPLLAASALRSTRELGSAGTALYAWNTAGAALGAAAASFWLPPLVGVRAGYAAGAGLSALAGVAAFALSRRTPPRPAPPPPRPDGAKPAPGLLGLAALSGFGAFAAQVLFVQSFAQVLNQSVYAFGAVLVVVLATLAAGAFGTSAIEARALATPRTLLGAALAASAVALAAFPALLFRVTGGLDYVGSGAPWPAYLLETLATAATAAGPALLAASLVLPAVFALAARGPAEDGGGAAGARLGGLAAANTAGAIAGAIAGPFALVPAAGLWGAFLALAAVYALPAVLLGDASRRLRIFRTGALAAGLAAVLLFASPLALPLTRLAPGERLVDQTAGADGLVAVVERAGERLIRIDNHYALGGTGEVRHEERQGHLPLVLHPGAERALFVGTATGITAGAALAHPLRSLELVEIVPSVARAARRDFAAANRGVYADPRARVVLDDARNFLRATGERFDVVVGDLFVPWRSGTGDLYTAEHFAAVRDHLRPGGLFCQWLPLYQLGAQELSIVLATFADVFPRAALFRGDFYGSYPIAALVGWRDAPASPEAVARAARRLAAAGERDRWVTDPVGIWALYVGPLPPAPPQVPRNTDDHPRVQFLAARAHAGGDRGRIAPLVGLAWIRFQEELLRRGAEPLYPALPEAARRAREGGRAFQLAGALYAAGRSTEASRALSIAADRLPAHLLAEGQPDPSAAELWFDP
jgi:spermidine synthase